MAEEKRNVFETLNKIDVSKFVEKKGRFNYLSWSHAWMELLKIYPDSTYTVYENQAGMNYHNDGKSAWVKVGVTVQGVELIEYLPIINHQNKSIPVGQIDSMNVNTAIQRCLTKAIARHGLGLYIYAGEDLPIVEEEMTGIKGEFIKLFNEEKHSKMSVEWEEKNVSFKIIKERIATAPEELVQMAVSALKLVS